MDDPSKVSASRSAAEAASESGTSKQGGGASSSSGSSSSEITLLSILHRLRDPLPATKRVKTLEKELKVAESLVRLRAIELKIAKLKMNETAEKKAKVEASESGTHEASADADASPEALVASAAAAEAESEAVLRASELSEASTETTRIISELKRARQDEALEKQKRFVELERKTATVQKYARVMNEKSRHRFFYSSCQRYALGKWFIQALQERVDWEEYPSEPWFTSPKCGTMHCPVGNVTVDFCDQPEYSMALCSFKGNEHISNKDLLAEAVRGHLDDFVPPTYVLRNRKWSPEGRAPPEDLIQSMKKTGLPWFVKDGRADYATGIIIYDDPLLAPKSDEIKDEKVYVVQPHISKPLLFGGAKFHIRQYFLIWSAPGYKYGAKLFVYVEGWLAIAKEKFEVERKMHAGQLDSDGTRTKPEEEVKTPNSKDKFVSRDRTLPWSRWEHYSQTWKAAKECTRRLVQCVRSKIEPCSPKNVFELFGADYMFDEHMHPWLLEVNAGPVVKQTEMPMIRGMLQKVLVKGRGRHRHEEGDWLEVPLERGNAGSAVDGVNGKILDSSPKDTSARNTFGEGLAGDAK